MLLLLRCSLRGRVRACVRACAFVPDVTSLRSSQSHLFAAMTSRMSRGPRDLSSDTQLFMISKEAIEVTSYTTTADCTRGKRSQVSGTGTAHTQRRAAGPASIAWPHLSGFVVHVSKVVHLGRTGRVPDIQLHRTRPLDSRRAHYDHALRQRRAHVDFVLQPEVLRGEPLHETRLAARFLSEQHH
jgi:hypothetical protein